MRIYIILSFFIMKYYDAYSQFSQPGQLDTAFNFGKNHSFFSSSNNPMPGQGVNGIVFSTVSRTDGKVLLGGGFASYNGLIRNNIVQLNADGVVDLSFQVGIGTNGQIMALALQPDGKVLVGGYFSLYKGDSCKSFTRLLTDGSVDPSFNTGTGVIGSVTAILIQPDGKILIAGDFSSYNGTMRKSIARINVDGTLDQSFNPGNGPNFGITSLALQPDGKVIVGGAFTTFNGVTRNRVARLLDTGPVDVSFGNGSGANNLVFSVAIQPNGKVLIGGDFTSYNGINASGVVRTHPDGTFDQAFNVVMAINSGVRRVFIQPDSKIVIGGFFGYFTSTFSSKLIRIDSSFNVDLSFNLGMDQSIFVWSIALQTDGKYIFGGNFNRLNNLVANRICRVSANGSLDNSFNAVTGASEIINSIVPLPGDKMVIGGNFSAYNNIFQNRLAVINANGSLDTTFTSLSGYMIQVIKVALQPDGKCIIAGKSLNMNNAPQGYFVRLNSDGSLDNNFASGLSVSSNVNDIVVQPDLKILLAGDFITNSGIPIRYISRIDQNGNLDTTFNLITGPFTQIERVVLQPDGKILIGGFFTSFNGVPRNRIARLNSNGSIDTSFNPGTGLNQNLWDIALQPDGKILLGGDFSTVNGLPYSKLVRLNANGSIDTTFQVGTGANFAVFSIGLQPDGKVLIGGDFTTINGIGRNRIARLNSNGSIDMTFNYTTGANGRVSELALQADGKLLIGGDFSMYGGFCRFRIARIHTGLPSLGVEEVNPLNMNLKAFPNPFIESVRIVNQKPFQYELYTIEGKIHTAGFSVSPELSISTSSWPSGTYVIRVITDEGVSVRKLVKE